MLLDDAKYSEHLAAAREDVDLAMEVYNMTWRRFLDKPLDANREAAYERANRDLKWHQGYLAALEIVRERLTHETNDRQA